MCEKQRRIDELELEISEISKNYREAEKLNSERHYNDIKAKYHTAQVLAVPVAIGFLGVVIALINN